MKFKLFIIMLSLLVICSSFAGAQETNENSQTNSTTSQNESSKKDVQFIDPGTLTNLTDFGSIWEITKLAGGLRWIIILVLVIGLATLLYKYAELLIDGRRSAQINQFNILTATLSEIEEIIASNPNNWIHQLSNNMMKIFKTTERAEDFHYEITNFVQNQQDKFATFQGKMAFLSDTAGALGLLGTVWGMFVTFSRGILDNQVILTGMGIALVTTLMGLVVSIVLNFFSTQIQGYFSKKIDAVQNKGEELRLQLLKYQRYRFKNLNAYLKNDENITENIMSDDEELEENKVFEIVPISGNNQSAPVNSRIKNPLVVQITNGDGRGISGQWVVFSVDNGNGTFENGNKVNEVISDKSGFAKSTVTLGKTVGSNVVNVRLKRENSKHHKFSILGKPASPSLLKYVSGNLQNCPACQELKEPFVVKLTDSYNNPIADYPVIFKVKNGKGYFPGKNQTYIARTDENGIAQGQFTLRPEPGFNAIMVYAKGLKRSKVEFEALGQ